MSEELKFKPDQVVNLNTYQVAGRFHPFTCPNRNRKTHRIFNGDLGALVATVRGWICPWCDYTQEFAHDFMCDPLPPDPVGEMFSTQRDTTAVQREREECAKVAEERWRHWRMPHPDDAIQSVARDAEDPAMGD